jgi:hypothetical protein
MANLIIRWEVKLYGLSKLNKVNARGGIKHWTAKYKFHHIIGLQRRVPNKTKHKKLEMN